MNLVETGFKDLYTIEPKVFGDERGYFFEIHNESAFQKLGLNYQFVQDNISVSEYGVIRGLHFQRGEYAQAKLIEVLQGKVLDVVVDLRKNSATYLKKFEVIISAKNKKQLLIPRGFAHGFSVLSEMAMFHYKCDNFYAKKYEDGIKINDLNLKIDWQIPTEKQIVNDRDLNFQTLEEFDKSTFKV